MTTIIIRPPGDTLDRIRALEDLQRLGIAWERFRQEDGGRQIRLSDCRGVNPRSLPSWAMVYIDKRDQPA